LVKPSRITGRYRSSASAYGDRVERFGGTFDAHRARDRRVGIRVILSKCTPPFDREWRSADGPVTARTSARDADTIVDSAYPGA